MRNNVVRRLKLEVVRCCFPSFSHHVFISNYVVATLSRIITVSNSKNVSFTINV